MQELLTLDGDALVDVEDDRQQRGDEQHLALDAVLRVEVVRHALDLDLRHGNAGTHVGQRVGLVAEEVREFVGGLRIDARLFLAAHRVAGSGEAAVAAGDIAHVEMALRHVRHRIIADREIVADEDQCRGIGVHRRGELRQAGRKLSDRIEAEELPCIDGRKGLMKAHSGRENRHPGGRKGIFLSARARRHHQRPHALPFVDGTNDPCTRSEDRDATQQPTLYA